jgi:acyl carrier protein
MTEQQVIDLIADALQIAPGKLLPDSTADDFIEWDSMGKLVLLSLLDRQGIAFSPDDAECLNSVQGILSIFRAAGERSLVSS